MRACASLAPALLLQRCHPVVELVVALISGWLGDGRTPRHAYPIEPQRGQILSLDASRLSLRAILAGEEVYLVPQRDGRVVVGATEEREGFDCRVTAQGISTLLSRAADLVPALVDATFCRAWAGLRPATPDGLPLLGPVPEVPGLVLCAGHSRNGVLLAPITGRFIAELAAGKSLPEDARALRPERFLEERARRNRG